MGRVCLATALAFLAVLVQAVEPGAQVNKPYVGRWEHILASGQREDVEFTSDGRYSDVSYLAKLYGTYVEESPGILLLKYEGKTLLGVDISNTSRVKYELRGRVLMMTKEGETTNPYLPVPQSSDETAERPATRDFGNQPDRPTTPSETPPHPNSGPAESSQMRLILMVNRALDDHDWRTLTRFTVDGLVDYFGHKRVTNAYIARDLQGDAVKYEWVHSTVYPDSFTHEVSDQHSSHWSGPMLYDSINMYSDALEKNGKSHKAMIRLTVGYVLDSAGQPAIYSLSLTVL